MFGHWVDYDAGKILIGAYGYSVKDEDENGAAYIFKQPDNGWQLSEKLVPPLIERGEKFGAYTVSYDSGTAVLGIAVEGEEGSGGLLVVQIPGGIQSK